MPAPLATTVRSALEAAGIEVYRVEGDEIHVAERVRLHLMDSGIRVHPGPGESTTIELTVRAQQSDFSGLHPAELIDRVRAAAGPLAAARGFVEHGSARVEVTNPLDVTHVLDVWHEVVYRKTLDDPNDLIDDVRWALGLERYVQ
ncbi:MAG: hypothetical protein KC543_16930 [Myxococcales bacterium]|nr:hypothetical protein [Myxococcales bacterium]